MMPPTSIDGTDITGATIDGTDVQEITVDGQTVFTALPAGAFDINLLSEVDTFDPNTGDNADLTFSATGDKLVWVSNSTDEVFSKDLSTPFDLSSRGASTDTFSLARNNPRGIAWNDLGDKLYVLFEKPEEVRSFNTGANFEISQITGQQASQSLNTSSSVQTITWRPDGSSFYCSDFAVNPAKIIQFDCGVNFDITSIGNASGDESVTANDTNKPRGPVFNNDGSLMFTIGQSTNELAEYSLSTPFSLNSASLTNNTRSLPGDTRSPRWSNDGTKFFYGRDTFRELTI